MLLILVLILSVENYLSCNFGGLIYGNIFLTIRHIRLFGRDPDHRCHAASAERVPAA